MGAAQWCGANIGLMSMTMRHRRKHGGGGGGKPPDDDDGWKFVFAILVGTIGGFLAIAFVVICIGLFA